MPTIPEMRAMHRNTAVADVPPAGGAAADGCEETVNALYRRLS